MVGKTHIHRLDYHPEHGWGFGLFSEVLGERGISYGIKLGDRSLYRYGPSGQFLVAGPLPVQMPSETFPDDIVVNKTRKTLYWALSQQSTIDAIKLAQTIDPPPQPLTGIQYSEPLDF